MKLYFSNLETPMGALVSVIDEAGVIRALQFADHRTRYLRHLREHLGAYDLENAPAPRSLSRALAAYFNGDLDALDDLPIAPAGTEFEHQVWKALREMPAGSTMHYGELARTLGFPDPRAAIDIGAANGANPIAIIVPCHRVIAKDGSLKGYAWGVHRKRWLLEHEGAPRTMNAKSHGSQALPLPGFQSFYEDMEIDRWLPTE